MNLPCRSRVISSGFTLIELLVVIAIIAILASVISVAAGSAINQAKRAKAGNMCTQIQTAIINYYTEYGVYPLPSGTTSDIAEGVGGTPDSLEPNLMFALSGNLNAYNPGTPQNNASGVSNTRNIAFLTLKKSEVDQQGVPINPFSSTNNAVYYELAMDGDYDGVLNGTGNLSIPDFTQWTQGSTCPNTGLKLTSGAAVWICCDPANLSSWQASKSPNYWLHTY